MMLVKAETRLEQKVENKTEAAKVADAAFPKQEVKSRRVEAHVLEEELQQLNIDVMKAKK